MMGAMVWKGGDDQTIQPGVAGIAQITFSEVEYDTHSLWKSQTNRFVIPKNISWARLSAQAIWHSVFEPSVTDNSHVRQIVIKKNFVSLADWYGGRPGWAVGQISGHTGTTNDIQATGPWLKVIEGDNFLVDAFHSSVGVGLTIRATNGTWFAIEIKA